ncbi:MAG TPA: LacI family DNA-binding transcriptional regulator [bacterium]|nr:LacI family DNA-binding transcriptional regulator [bacterium]
MPLQTQRVSMRDVAKAVGVSVSAVSLAIKNSPRVSAPVRQKIQEKIRELGYQPDPILKALCHYRRSKITAPVSAELAWINCWPKPKELRAFREFELYWQGALEEARRAGFRLEEFRLQEYESFARLEQVLRARNINGILIPPHGTLWPANWPEFRWNDFCIVRFGHSVAHPRAHLVTSDQLTDGMIAFENIWHKGYRRIAYVTTRDTTSRGTRFSAGFLLAQLKAGARARLYPLLMSDKKHLKEDQKQLTVWLRKIKPDAIFTDCLGLHRVLVSCGYQVPKDIGLAVASVLDGGATAGIDQNSKEIGKAAIQLLISLINHNERGIPDVCRELLIEGRWVDGNTLPGKK